MPVCSVITCKYGTEGHDGEAEGIVFHTFPTIDEVRAKWVDMTGRDDWTPTSKDYVCSRHFRDSDYFIKRSGKRYLKIAAIPCEYVVYRHLYPDEEVTGSNAVEVKVEVNEEEASAAGGQQAEGPIEIQIPDEGLDFCEPSTSTFGQSIVYPDSTIFDGNDNAANEWSNYDSEPFHVHLPASIFEDSSQEVGSSSFDDRYHREVWPFLNPFPPLDFHLNLEQLPPPKTPEPIHLPFIFEPNQELMAVQKPNTKEVNNQEELVEEEKEVEELVPSAVEKRQRGREKLLDIRRIMARRKSSKKAIAAALAEVRQARKIQIQLQSGRMTDFDKAAAIIALQTSQITKLAIKHRRLKKILKRISAVLRQAD